MGKIIAIANQKGGVSKTTTTHNLCVALMIRGKKVLMVDLDSQASLTFCVSVKSPVDYIGANICTLLEHPRTVNPRDCIHVVGNTDRWGDKMQLIPSIIDLAKVENLIFSTPGREVLLAHVLMSIVDDYDYILLDCPPQLGLITTNAFTAADGIIIPCKTDELSYRGIEQLMETVESIQCFLNPSLKVCGAVATMYMRRLLTDNKILRKLEDNYNLLGVVPHAAIVKRGIDIGLSAIELEPLHEVSQAFLKIADKLIDMEENT